jgi:hypothetical protein
MPTIVYRTDPGLTTTLELYADNSDTLAESLTGITQETNRAGMYIATPTVSGIHFARVINEADSSLYADGWVNVGTGVSHVQQDYGTMSSSVDITALTAQLTSFIANLLNATIILVEEEIELGRLSLYKDEARTGGLKTSYSWDIVPETPVDLTVNGKCFLTIRNKDCNGDLAGHVIEGVITDRGSNTYRCTFPIPLAVANNLLLGVQQTFRAEVNDGSGTDSVLLDAGEVVVS